MIGFAAEFNGAVLCIKLATAIVVCVTGMKPYAWSRSNTKYGLQQIMKTRTEMGRVLFIDGIVRLECKIF